MMKHCSNCYYRDMCEQEEPCDDYTPIDESAEDEEIAEMIEERRQEYYEAWFEYIKENDEYFF